MEHIRYIVLSDIPAGKLRDTQDEVGLSIIREIGMSVLCIGKVFVLDPNNAIRSRMKNPVHDLKDEIYYLMYRLMGYDEFLGRVGSQKRDAKFRDLFDMEFEIDFVDTDSCAGIKGFSIKAPTWDELKDTFISEMKNFQQSCDN